MYLKIKNTNEVITMTKPGDLNLLKDLKGAYKFHSQGNQRAFTEKLTAILVSYGAELERVDEVIRKKINEIG
jgi:hypothetical protein